MNQKGICQNIQDPFWKEVTKERQDITRQLCQVARDLGFYLGIGETEEWNGHLVVVEEEPDGKPQRATLVFPWTSTGQVDTVYLAPDHPIEIPVRLMNLESPGRVWMDFEPAAQLVQKAGMLLIAQDIARYQRKAERRRREAAISSS